MIYHKQNGGGDKKEVGSWSRDEEERAVGRAAKPEKASFVMDSERQEAVAKEKESKGEYCWVLRKCWRTQAFLRMAWVGKGKA